MPQFTKHFGEIARITQQLAGVPQSRFCLFHAGDTRSRAELEILLDQSFALSTQFRRLQCLQRLSGYGSTESKSAFETTF